MMCLRNDHCRSLLVFGIGLATILSLTAWAQNGTLDERLIVAREGVVGVCNVPEVKYPTDRLHKVRIKGAEGEQLEMARSRNGDQLWVRRRYDDESEMVNKFTLRGPMPEGQNYVLQFVDGVVERRDASALGLPCRHVLRHGKSDVIELFF